MRLFILALLFIFFAVVSADVYMHALRGSNDRGCEQNANRNNANRLFDSQNNAAGGYACPRAKFGSDIVDSNMMTDTGNVNQNHRYRVMEGSLQMLQWTNQHQCGGGRTDCQIILQYMMDDAVNFKKAGYFPTTTDRDFTASRVDIFRDNEFYALRDGTPTVENDDVTDTIPDELDKGPPTTDSNRRYAYHESHSFYELCQRTERNKGLYTSDQRVRRNDQRGTRQNPNGNRRGLECPEERDYYPWWQPAPWIDIAVLDSSGPSAPVHSADYKAFQDGSTATNPCGSDSRCSWYMSNTQNINGKGYCDITSTAASFSVKSSTSAWSSASFPNNYDDCMALGTNFEWRTFSWADVYATPPDMVYGRVAFAHINHLGNALNPVLNFDGVESTGDGATERLFYYTNADNYQLVAKMIPAVNQPNTFVWQVPDCPTFLDSDWYEGPNGLGATDACSAVAVRLRYNISTGDYCAWPDEATDNSACLGHMATAANNTVDPQDPVALVTQDPYIYIGPGATSAFANRPQFVSLALNTNQYGRTFQDRSWAFSITSVPTSDSTVDHNSGEPPVYGSWLNTNIVSSSSDRYIVNVNVIGKRGNIVQTYPSMEYRFVPDKLAVRPEDGIHFQWTGSDYNPRRGCNDGEGGPPDGDPNHNARADRSNLVPMEFASDKMPMDLLGYDTDSTDSWATKRATAVSTVATNFPFLDSAFWSDEDAYDAIMRLAYLDQEQDEADLEIRNGVSCKTPEELDEISDKNTREQIRENCSKMNGKFSPYFNGGVLTNFNAGTYNFLGSRNNNFSNRHQGMLICVSSSSTETFAGCSYDPFGDWTDSTPHTIYQSPGQSSICNDEANSNSAGNNNGASSCIIGSSGSSSDILNGETFATTQGDNDKTGDGDLFDCDFFQSYFNSKTVEEQIALAVGLLFVGIAFSWGAYYAYNRYESHRTAGTKFGGDTKWHKNINESELI